MRRAFVLAGAALTIGIGQPAAAQEFKPPANLFGQAKPAPKPPAIDWNARPRTADAAAGTPSILCGMTVVRADPNVDAKMRVAAPERGLTFTMRAVPRRECKTP